MIQDRAGQEDAPPAIFMWEEEGFVHKKQKIETQWHKIPSHCLFAIYFMFIVRKWYFCTKIWSSMQNKGRFYFEILYLVF